MTTKLTRAVPLMLAALFLALKCEATEAWEGKFQWDNQGHLADYGNVQQAVTVEVNLTAPDEVTVSCIISWKEGALLELGGMVPRQQVLRQVGSDGIETFTVHFTFTDSFANTGECDLIIKGNVATLKAKTTSIEDKRAARQYGDYTLERASP